MPSSTMKEPVINTHVSNNSMFSNPRLSHYNSMTVKIQCKITINN